MRFMLWVKEPAWRPSGRFVVKTARAPSGSRQQTRPGWTAKRMPGLEPGLQDRMPRRLPLDFHPRPNECIRGAVTAQPRPR